MHLQNMVMNQKTQSIRKPVIQVFMHIGGGQTVKYNTAECGHPPSPVAMQQRVLKYKKYLKDTPRAPHTVVFSAMHTQNTPLAQTLNTMEIDITTNKNKKEGIFLHPFYPSIVVCYMIPQMTFPS